MLNYKKAGLLGLIIILLAACAFYFGYWIRTPQYALNVISKALSQHDAETFSQYVDLDNLYDKLFDDSFTAEVKPNKERANAALLTHLTAIKRLVVPVFTAATLNYVKTGNAELTGSTANDPTGRGVQLAMGMVLKLGLTNLEFKSFDGLNKNGSVATAKITIYDRQLEKELPLLLKMQAGPDGHWKLVSLDDIPAYLKLRQTALDAKLKELNKPKAAKIATIARILDGKDAPQFQVLVVRQPNLTYALKAFFSLVNLSSKDIASVSGIMKIYDKENVQRFATSFEAGHIAAGKLLYTSNTWELNPYIADQQILRRIKMAEVKAVFEITSIIFSDRTSITLQDRLPDFQ